MINVHTEILKMAFLCRYVLTMKHLKYVARQNHMHFRAISKHTLDLDARAIGKDDTSFPRRSAVNDAQQYRPTAQASACESFGTSVSSFPRYAASIDTVGCVEVCRTLAVMLPAVSRAVRASTMRLDLVANNASRHPE